MRITSFGNQKLMHQEAGGHAHRECDVRVCWCTQDRALIDFFFNLASTQRRISEFHRRPRTSGPSEHPEAERRGEAADCARSTSFDLNIMRCIRITKQYTLEASYPPISIHHTDTVSLCWQQRIFLWSFNILPSVHKYKNLYTTYTIHRTSITVLCCNST